MTKQSEEQRKRVRQIMSDPDPVSIPDREKGSEIIVGVYKGFREDLLKWKRALERERRERQQAAGSSASTTGQLTPETEPTVTPPESSPAKSSTDVGPPPGKPYAWAKQGHMKGGLIIVPYKGPRPRGDQKETPLEVSRTTASSVVVSDKSSTVLDHEAEQDVSHGPSGPRIRCPQCGWSPCKDDLWFCACGHAWNTFDTGGVCPACLHQWTSTQCLLCSRWSQHSQWYGE